MSALPERETLTVEFKSDRERLGDDELVEELVAMANTQGGELFVGVEDDGTPTGLHHSHRDVIRLAAMVANKTRPSLSVRAEVLPLAGVPVARIEVPRMGALLVATSTGRVMRRRLKHDGLPETIPVFPYEIPGLLAGLGSFDVSDRPAPGATLADLDPLERQRLRQFVVKYNGDGSLLGLSDEELDGALGLTALVDGTMVPTVTGVLLIGREGSLRRLVPAHEVMFQVLAGTAVRANESFRGALLGVVDAVLDRFRARNEEQEIDVGMFRVPVPDYDERAFREGLVNALSHRDYTLLGATHVQFTDAGIAIMNPGGFIEGVTVENLLDAAPRSRNPRLADALKRVGLAERTGRGVDRIFQGLLRYGRPEPDYSASTTTTVTLLIPGARADTAFLRMILDAEERQGGPLRVEDLRILAALRTGRRLRTADLAGALHRAEAATHAALERLVEAGLVEAHGATRGRSYTLSAQVYRQSGQAAEYVRQTGFDAIQREQMVLKYVEAHGRITRREAMELCRISEDQAKRLLQRMVRAGQIAPQGHGKATSYGRRP